MPQKPRRRSVGMRCVALLLVLLLTAASSGRALAHDDGQTPVPTREDILPKLAYVQSIAVILGALMAGGAGPVVLLMGMAWVNLIQGTLWSDALMVDERMLSAWTVESLLELNYQIRGAMSMVPNFANKLKADVPLLEARISQIERDIFQKNPPPAEAALMRDDKAILEATLEAVQRRIADATRLQQELDARGKAVLARFEALRRSVIAGEGSVIAGIERVPPTKEQQAEWAKKREPPLTVSTFTPQVMKENWELTRLLVEYVQLATKFEADLVKPMRVPVTIAGRLQDRDVAPSALQQLRMVIDNQSSNLVFFIRLIPKQKDVSQNRDEPMSLARGGWIPLYPRGEAMRVNDMLKLGAPPPAQTGGPVGAGAAGGGPQSNVEIQLPSQVWFPIAAGDRLEVRVATYGPERQTIRWMALRGRQMRPDLHSLRRTFYYVGYDIAYSGQFVNTWRRHYSINEQYQWRFTGTWAGKVEENQPTSYGDLYGVVQLIADMPIRAQSPATMVDVDNGGRREAPQLVNDHFMWTIPTDPDELKKLENDPFLKAEVIDGKATIVKTTYSKRTVVPESGRGILNIMVQPW